MAFPPIEDFDARDTVIEQVRWLIGQGYRQADQDKLEQGVAALWNDSQYWMKAINARMDRVIEELVHASSGR